MTTKGRGLRAPGNDVNLLALQFLHHRLDAAAAHADTSADRVDRLVAADNRHLGAAARIARHRFNLDDAVIDFRHFLREELGKKPGCVRERENLRAHAVPRARHK